MLESDLQDTHRFRLVSQTWHAIKWEHEVITVGSSKYPSRSCILIITGGKSNEKDLEDAREISRISRLPVATLFEIPNQPIFGMKEDDLIAHTFEEYLKSGDASWPLLFPMVKSAIKTMDGLEAASGYKNFIVTGASKRGWTTWLTAASADRRVIGIAPQVYDNLNLLAQMPHQHELWGYYSPQIQDYTKRGLQDALATTPGQRLAAMVDPFSYLPRIKVPILIEEGANDPYWAPDALNLYASALPASFRTLYLPNEAHTFQDKKLAWNALGTFARLCARKKLLPAVPVKAIGRSILVGKNRALVSVKLFVAESENWDFHASKWVAQPGLTAPGSTKKQAALVLLTFRNDDGTEVTTSSSILLLR